MILHRILNDHDTAAFLRIDRECQSAPWDERDFVEFHDCSRRYGYVAQTGQIVIGYVLIESHDDAIVVARMAVDRQYRRRGVGRGLLGLLCGKVRRRLLVVDVPDTNLAAHLFLKSCGLRGSVLDAGTYRFAWVAPQSVRQEDQAWVKQCL